ncbi:hypothetical protein LTR10_024252 [Elasticomyces elasticus]|uniref:Serine aminopeptidase S33 domain-containing protein n=1 Tax=Exophiala sideris TaxID=1016849 RepID=A0ABR0IV25_9EURO|nr:hypothetical protein LTR10_024252 [Elasticomyces elasticus]KAK5020850.1 hypothetical protein LTS07_011401 [Exophiala sideris]KAK5022840.1 hypothetical protein LTR13_011404 [Exophiala sideris]KAK5048389.1 hypothetical protein LTR69_011415 [Exophiala sideris]KAK5176017.1 hypothetical protein LTR44_011424 [Eurotiomycetes sp. CCFEE 6388]
MAFNLSLLIYDQVSIQYGTSREVSELIDLLPMFITSDESFGFDHIFCVGVSLGGHATYHVLSDDPRVSAGVVIIGCPDVAALMEERASKNDFERKLPPSFRETARRLSPKLEEVAKKGILILRDIEDTLVPWGPSEIFVNKLPKEKTRIVGYEGIGHELTQAMMQDTAKWICDVRHGT